MKTISVSIFNDRVEGLLLVIALGIMTCDMRNFYVLQITIMRYNDEKCINIKLKSMSIEQQRTDVKQEFRMKLI